MIHTKEGEASPKNETFIGNLDPGRVVAGASSIVSRAADILEENIAEGIVIAKRLERKVIDVDKVRGGDERALMSRFRKDAHEALDIFFDALTTATHSLNDLVERVGQAAPPAAGTAGQPPELRPATPVAAGQSTTVPLRLENESKEREMTVDFTNEALVGPDGQTINARNVRFAPRRLVLPPGGRGEITITVKAPKTTAPGHYRGLLRDKQLDGLRATLAVEVR